MLSVTTAMRNIASSGLIALSNGHYRFDLWRKGVESIKRQAAEDNEAITDDEALRRYTAKLIRLGVNNDGGMSEELMRIRRDSSLVRAIFAEPDEYDTHLEAAAKQAAKPLAWALDKAQTFYRFGDDFWKQIGFENELQMLLDSDFESDKPEFERVDLAEKEAAARISNVYPTYSKVGNVMQRLRRFPFLGSFVAFASEVVRTGVNKFTYIKTDYAAGRREMAARKAIGLAMTTAGLQAAAALTKTLLSVDDEEEDAARQNAAPWNRNSLLLWLYRDEDGAPVFLDLTYHDPYGWWSRWTNTIRREIPPGQMAAEVLKELLTTFLGEEIGMGALLDIRSNRTGTGAPIWGESQSVGEIAEQVMNHLRRAVQPGTMNNAERILKASTGYVELSGRTYSLEEEMAALLGFRVTKTDPMRAVRYRGAEVNRKVRDAERRFVKALQDPNEVSRDEVRDAFDSMIERRDRAYRQTYNLIVATRKTDIPDKDLYELLSTRAGFSSADARLLMRGKIPPYELSSRSIQNLLERVRLDVSPEAAARVERRLRENRDLFRPRRAKPIESEE